MKKYLSLGILLLISSVALGVYVEPPYPFSNGGTSATTQQGALNAIAGAVTNHDVIRCDGANCSVAAIQAADVPTLNQSTTGTANNVTGIVAPVNGGTGLNNSAATGIQTFAAGTGIVSSFTSAYVSLFETVSTTQGATQYGGSGGTPTNLAIGTAGQSYCVNAGANAPSWCSNAAPAVVSLGTCTTSMAVDFSLGQQFTVTLTNGDTCAFTFSNTTGRTATIHIYQPSSGGGTGVASWSGVVWPATTTPTITTGNSAFDKCTFVDDGIDTGGSCLQAF